MTSLFRSDDHFFHRFVAKLRGFEDDMEGYHKTLIVNHNKKATKKDVTWFLGDICVGGKETILATLEQIDQMNGRKRLILGNHDTGHPMHRQAHKFLPIYQEVFEYVAPFQRTSVGGREVMLSHFPYATDRGPARYMQYRLRDEGALLLHGHLHSPEKVTSPREIHVGLDAWDLSPASEREIMELLPPE